MSEVNLYWHIHHDMLCESLIEPLENRIKYIEANKSVGEVKTRLRLLHKVSHPERLPQEWQEAYQKWQEAYQKWQEADQKRKEAYQKRQEAYHKYASQIESLHKIECPNCPWNGRTIFP